MNGLQPAVSSEVKENITLMRCGVQEINFWLWKINFLSTKCFFFYLCVTQMVCLRLKAILVSCEIVVLFEWKKIYKFQKDL